MRGMSWERLGREVARRRRSLGLTQAELAAQGSFSLTTLRGIENNRVGRLSPRLREALEKAIGWEAGSVDAVLDGLDPRVSTTNGAVRPPAAGQENLERAAAERVAVVRRLLKMRSAYLEHQDEMSEQVRAAMGEQVAAAIRETEEALMWMLPLLGKSEQAEAIRALAEIQQTSI